MTEQEQYKAFAAVVARSWGDEDFRAQLIADPTATLVANGVAVPAGKKVIIVEDTDTDLHVVLPSRPGELTDEELDSVAGGFPSMSYGCDSEGQGIARPRT